MKRRVYGLRLTGRPLWQNLPVWASQQQRFGIRPCETWKNSPKNRNPSLHQSIACSSNTGCINYMGPTDHPETPTRVYCLHDWDRSIGGAVGFRLRKALGTYFWVVKVPNLDPFLDREIRSLKVLIMLPWSHLKPVTSHKMMMFFGHFYLNVKRSSIQTLQMWTRWWVYLSESWRHRSNPPRQRFKYLNEPLLVFPRQQLTISWS